MLTINLEESDCFAAWISVTDVPGLEPKVIDGRGTFELKSYSTHLLIKANSSSDDSFHVCMDGLKMISISLTKSQQLT